MKKEALLYEKKKDGSVRCHLCSHFCVIKEGCGGKCGVRKNESGILYSLVYGCPVAAGLDPIEKKPIYHFLPGTSSYSIATAGCNFSCGFCQNYSISSITPADAEKSAEMQLMPAEVVRNAGRSGAASIAYTYTEPTVFFEYAMDTAKLAREKGIANIFVSNGYMTEEALDMINPFLDAANVDLKYFDDEMYKKACGARLKPVLKSIEKMKELGVWVEITTLIIPGENNSPGHLDKIAGYIAGLDKNIPWHISRFFPKYKYGNIPPTDEKDLRAACRIAKEKGLNYVYPGNVGWENSTDCPSCGKRLIERNHFSVEKNLLDEGKCPACGHKIAGIFRFPGYRNPGG